MLSSDMDEKLFERTRDVSFGVMEPRPVEGAMVLGIGEVLEMGDGRC